MLQGTIKFAKCRAGCRYCVYETAEKCHGKTRRGNDSDGIYYIDRSSHLFFQLLFREEMNAEEFLIQVSNIPMKSLLIVE